VPTRLWTSTYFVHLSIRSAATCWALLVTPMRLRLRTCRPPLPRWHSQGRRADTEPHRPPTTGQAGHRVTEPAIQHFKRSQLALKRASKARTATSSPRLQPGDRLYLVALPPPVHMRAMLSATPRAALSGRFPAVSGADLLTGPARKRAKIALRRPILSEPPDFGLLVRN